MKKSKIERYATAIRILQNKSTYQPTYTIEFEKNKDQLTNTKVCTTRDVAQQTDIQVEIDEDNKYSLSSDKANKFFEKTFEFWKKENVGPFVGSWRLYLYRFEPIDKRNVRKVNITTDEEMNRLSREDCLFGEDYVIENDNLVPVKYKWMMNENENFVKINTNTWTPLNTSWQHGMEYYNDSSKIQNIPYVWVRQVGGDWTRINTLNGSEIESITDSHQVVRTHKLLSRDHY